jgi:segregation and condensation protein A
MDLLLRLIERRQLTITDISLVEVTDHFLEYAADLPSLPPTVVADFATIASRLLVLKSRSLLPAMPVADDESEPDDLTRQLIAYRAVKQAAESLDQRQRRGLRSFTRPMTMTERHERAPAIAPDHPRRLVQALRWCTDRARPEPRPFQPSQVISLAAMTRRILASVARAGRSRFGALFGPRSSRPERVAGFIALLSLWKRRRVEVRQDAPFGEIEIETVRHVRQAADD